MGTLECFPGRMIHSNVSGSSRDLHFKGLSTVSKHSCRASKAQLRRATLHQRSVIQQTPAEVGKSSQQAASCESTSVGLHVKIQTPQRV